MFCVLSQFGITQSQFVLSCNDTRPRSHKLQGNLQQGIIVSKKIAELIVTVIHFHRHGYVRE